MEKSKSFRLPILQGVLPIKSNQISAEIIAGLTLAAIAIGEVAIIACLMRVLDNAVAAPYTWNTIDRAVC